MGTLIQVMFGSPPLLCAMPAAVLPQMDLGLYKVQVPGHGLLGLPNSLADPLALPVLLLELVDDLGWNGRSWLAGPAVWLGLRNTLADSLPLLVSLLELIDELAWNGRSWLVGAPA